MSQYIIERSTLVDIADAIREKRGTSGTILVSDLAEQVSLIDGGGSALLRDSMIIPDSYNTGCHDTLTKFDILTDTSGIYWRTDDPTALQMDFNGGSAMRNLSDNQTVVFENTDFTDYDAFKVMNAGSYTPSVTYYRTGVTIVFKNCLFKSVSGNYSFPSESSIQFIFEDCMMAQYGISNSKLYRCLLGNCSFYQGYYGYTISGDVCNPSNWTSFYDCYFMDCEPKVTVEGSAHVDILQTFPPVDGLHIYNCRFEAFDMPYSPKVGGWSYSMYWEDVNTNSSMEYCILHGGGYYQTSIKKGVTNTVRNNLIDTSYGTPCYPSDEVLQMTDNWADVMETLLVSSVWYNKADDKVYIVCSNDIHTAKTLRVVIENENGTTTERSFSMPACPTRTSEDRNTISKWSDLPYDRKFEIEAVGVRNIKCYDGTTLIRTFTVSEATNPFWANYLRPLVPQTGTWQYKTTPTTGFILIGKDDDVSDSAQFVRMVNGYGYPVTLNSCADSYNKVVTSDADETYSLYPAGTTANFPNGTTIGVFDKWVVDNNKGEIALHGWGDEQLWDSSTLTGDVLDTMYSTYTTGGGTKTKEELKAAIMEKYAEFDVAQGATNVMERRELLEDVIGDWVYTIGRWGGDFDFIIDGITVGEATDCANEDALLALARQQNFMGDGTLSHAIIPSQSPYKIFRDSGALINAITAATDCQLAYDYKVCIDLFIHFYLNGTQERWQIFKDVMDTIKSYVDQGKVQVITRKQYYDLGEFVSNPIVTLSLTTVEQSYPLDTVLTASDFICKAILADSTEVVCSSDRILDYSNVDTSTEGIYSATLEYRGFKATGSVQISSVTPGEYVIRNYTASGDSMVYNANYGTVSPSVTYENGKSYRMEFDFTAETTTEYNSHYFIFEPEKINGQVYVDNLNAPQYNSTNGVTTFHAIIDWDCIRTVTINNFVLCRNAFHTTVGNWTISNGCVYEIPGA